MKTILALALLIPAASFAEPPAELSVEKWFAGTWTCKGKSMGGVEKAGATESQIEARLDLGGYWLESRIKQLAGPMKGQETVESFSTFDGKAHTRFYFIPGGLAHLSGAGWAGDKLVFDGEETVGGQTKSIRHTITKQGEDGFTALIESAGADGKLAESFEETCTRKKK